MLSHWSACITEPHNMSAAKLHVHCWSPTQTVQGVFCGSQYHLFGTHCHIYFPSATHFQDWDFGFQWTLIQPAASASEVMALYKFSYSKVIFSLNRLQLKLWASSTLQLVTSWTTLSGGWLSTVTRLQRQASCINTSPVLIQRYNTALLHDGFLMTPWTDVPLHCLLLLNF